MYTYILETRQRVFLFWACVVTAFFGFVTPAFAIDLYIDQNRSDVAIDAQRLVVTGRDYFENVNQAAVDALGLPFDINQVQVDVRLQFFDDFNEVLFDRKIPAVWSVDPVTGDELWTAEFFDNAVPQDATSFVATIERGDDFGESNLVNDTWRQVVRWGNVTLLDKPDFSINWNTSFISPAYQEIVVHSGRPDVEINIPIRASFIWTYGGEDDYASDASTVEMAPLGGGRYVASFFNQKPRGAEGFVVTLDSTNVIEESSELNNMEFSPYDGDAIAPDFYLIEDETVVNELYQEIVIGNSGDNDFREDLEVTFCWADDAGNADCNDLFGEAAFLGENGNWILATQVVQSGNFEPTRYIINIDAPQHIAESNEDNNLIIRRLNAGSFIERTFAALFGRREADLSARRFFPPETDENARENRWGFFGDAAQEQGEDAIQQRQQELNEQRELESRINLKTVIAQSYLGEDLQVILTNTEPTTADENIPDEVLVRAYFVNATPQRRDDTLAMEQRALRGIGEEGAIVWRTPNISLRQELAAYNRQGSNAIGYRIEIDPNNEILETNEEDNTYRRAFLPDFSPRAFFIDAVEDSSWFKLTLLVEKTNPDVQHPPLIARARFYDQNGDPIFDDHRVINRSADDIVVGSADVVWTIEPWQLTEELNTVEQLVHIPVDAASISVKLDVTHEIPELDESNNRIELGMFQPNQMMMLMMPGTVPSEGGDDQHPGGNCDAGSVPGDVLYFMDRAGERVREWFAFGNEAEAELMEIRSCERYAELDVLLEKDDTHRVEKQLEEVEKVQERRRVAIGSMKQEGNPRWQDFADKAFGDAVVHVAYLDEVEKDLGAEKVVPKKQKAVDVAADLFVLSQNKSREVSGSNEEKIFVETLGKELEASGLRLSIDKQTVLVESIVKLAEEKEKMQSFVGQCKEEYVCVTDGNSEQTYVGEDVPRGLRFLYCGECRYQGGLPESNEVSPYSECGQERYVCIANQGRLETYLGIDVPDGGEFLHCGDCTYDEVIERQGNDRFPQCADETYVCIDTRAYGQQTHLKESAPEGMFLHCGDCRYEQGEEEARENNVQDEVPEEQIQEAPKEVQPADLYIKDTSFSPQSIVVDPGQKVYVFNVTGVPVAILGDIETRTFESYDGYTLVAPTTPGSYALYSSQNKNVVGTLVVRAPKQPTPVEEDKNPFPQCEKEQYVCIDTGAFGQQTHLKESAPEGRFVSCGDCQYTIQEVESPDEVQPECRVHADCSDKNQCTTDSCINGSCVYSEVKSCGDTEYSCTDGIDNDRNGAVDCNDSQCASNAACVVVKDLFPQCETDYVCIDTGAFGQQTHLKESAPEGTFVQCGDCTYAPVVETSTETKTSTNDSTIDTKITDVKIASYTILITDSGFSPATLSAIGGSKITFVNQTKQAEKITGDIRVGEIKAGTSVSITIPEKSGASYGFVLTENTKAPKGVITVK